MDRQSPAQHAIDRASGTTATLLTFEQALAVVQERLHLARLPTVETLALERARGRFLAEDVAADRDYPPFPRAMRDGYAVRAADLKTLPAALENLGELRAGESFAGRIGPGQCVEIMTGAPLPDGADCVVMIEQTERRGNRVTISRSAEPGENVAPQGSEAGAGSTVLRRGRRLGPGEIGLLASVGQARVNVSARPHVAILATGDELVAVEQRPEWFQIRNSNAVSLAAQVESAGGVPCPLGVARDHKESLQRLIEEGLKADLLLMSGGVSMGKYDYVETVLAGLGAEFYFQEVAIRPGKPLVFGRAREKFFFGLPGNPVSTYVTFEVFVRPAIGILQGADFAKSNGPVFLRARLAKPWHRKPGLTAFVPARVEIESGDPVVRFVEWQGSGDLVGVAAANCFLVVHPQQADLAAGEWVDVMPKQY